MKPLWAVLSMLVLGLFMVPGAAFAAPPANDKFADREVLSGSLPIEVTRSNVEATKEPGGEYIPGLSPAGHSIWFEWEATDTDWVTVGACGTDFPIVLAVLTGTDPQLLTPVANGNADEGPDCPFSQRQYTFKAVSGSKYLIAVDGNNFHMPEAPMPVTEGDVALRIEETPLPPNDDFADATTITAPVNEEPGGRRFYFAIANGFNWTASEEAVEPPAAAPAAGLSVWYRWTAPGTGFARISVCCSARHLLGVYSGSDPGNLEVHHLGPSGVGPSLEMHVFEGQTFYIGVDSPIEESSGEADPGFFQLQISMELPPLPKPPSGGGGTVVTPPPVAPETKVISRALKHQIGLAKFRFTSTVAGSSFRCKLDKGPFKPCKSPKTYRRLKPGRHIFQVKAISPSGMADPKAWVGRFRIAESPQR